VNARTAALAAAITPRESVASASAGPLMLQNFALILLGLGRVMLGALYVYAGVRHFFILPKVSGIMATHGVPYARALLIAGSSFQTVAGALLMLGLCVSACALGLAVFTLIASAMVHDFWRLAGPARDAALTTWRSNIAIVSGLLVAAASAM
jgi:putative oxidoreductase